MKLEYLQDCGECESNDIEGLGDEYCESVLGVWLNVMQARSESPDKKELMGEKEIYQNAPSVKVLGLDVVNADPSFTPLVRNGTKEVSIVNTAP
jgi:hypothetical protein